MKSKKLNRRLTLALFYAILLVAVAGALFPVYWMIKSSLTPNEEMYSLRPSLVASKPTLQHYKQLFTETAFMGYFRNSLYVAILSTIVALAVSIGGSYAMTRLRFKGRSFMARSIILSYLMPTAVLFIPMYMLVSKLGLGDNKNSLVIVYQTFIVPYCCYMLMNYFRAIPVSLEEAAIVDGCTNLQALLKVILPIAAPSIAVVATFAFTLSWNEYTYALVMTTSPSQQTVTIGISGFKYSDQYIWGLLMSSSVISSIPAVILYMLAQNLVISGIASGGVKQ